MSEEDKKGARLTDIFDDIAFTFEDFLRILDEKCEEHSSTIILFDESGPPRGLPYFRVPWCPLCGHGLEEHHNGRCHRATFLYNGGAHRPPRVMMCPCGRLP